MSAIDRTLELDSEEKVVAWPGSQDSTIAEAILSSYGFTPQVETTTDSPDPDVHIVLQRGSDLAFLRSLATKWGYATFLEATEAGIVGHFEPIDPLADPQGELSLGFGTDSQHVDATVNLVEGQRVKLSRIPALSDSAQDADETGDDQAQGAHSLAAQTTVLLRTERRRGRARPDVDRTGDRAQVGVRRDAQGRGRHRPRRTCSCAPASRCSSRGSARRSRAATWCSASATSSRSSGTASSSCSSETRSA